ncbi:hypothetical protein MTR67_016951 [Solanum verrucosum]|uniref:Uncharacterized protein n=1 Tax=Solanum verrucosum TaxID=315347 RepID=A0AAF0QHT1_SOLVR|nr:hypothetical protein MTR67_016951 [Solanum verrucosum]
MLNNFLLETATPKMAQARSRVKQLRELLFPISGQVILKLLQQMHQRLVLEMMKTMNVNGSVHLVGWVKG